MSVRTCSSLPHDECLASCRVVTNSEHRLRVCVDQQNSPPAATKPKLSTAHRPVLRWLRGRWLAIHTMSRTGPSRKKIQNWGALCRPSCFRNNLARNATICISFIPFLLAYLAVFITLANQALSPTSTTRPPSVPSPAHTFFDMFTVQWWKLMVKVPTTPTPKIRCIVYFAVKSNK